MSTPPLRPRFVLRRRGRRGGAAAAPPEGLRAGLRGLSLNHLIPNILTMLGLCAGRIAVRFAFEGRWEPAMILIIVAGVIDGLDGRLARLLKTTSRFGAEFDSLSDFLSFGVAPALILHLWSLQNARGLGFVACLLFAVCMALRLARFNAAIDPPPDAAPPPRAMQNFFTGVPAPAGAGLALFPMFASLAFEGWGFPNVAAALRHPAFVAPLLVVVALLLVSTLPTWSIKKLKLPRQAVLPLLLGAAAYVALLFAEPWAALAAAGLIYAGLIPSAWGAHRRLLAAEFAEAPRPASPGAATGD